MKALLVIDVQKDFCPGGALPVPRGDEVVPVINRLMKDYPLVVATGDWHPPGHGSFASTRGGKPGDVIPMDGMIGGVQVLWPDHCVQGSPGAGFHEDLDLRPLSLILHKGADPAVDSYSAFCENNGAVTGLTGYLRSRGVTAVDIVGLATDYCVRYSALDALKDGFDTRVLPAACRGVNVPDGSVEEAMTEMEAAGVRIADV